MRRVNPLYIPRNQRVEEALSAASDHGDMAPFHALLAVLQHPFDEAPGQDRYAQPAQPASHSRFEPQFSRNFGRNDIDMRSGIEQRDDFRLVADLQGSP